MACECTAAHILDTCSLAIPATAPLPAQTPAAAPANVWACALLARRQLALPAVWRLLLCRASKELPLVLRCPFRQQLHQFPKKKSLKLPNVKPKTASAAARPAALAPTTLPHRAAVASTKRTARLLPADAAPPSRT
jgi:hypothetical protein